MPPKRQGAKKGKKVKKLVVNGVLQDSVEGQVGAALLNKMNLGQSVQYSVGDDSFNISLSQETPRSFIQDSYGDEESGSKSYREIPDSKTENLLQEFHQEEEKKENQLRIKQKPKQNAEIKEETINTQEQLLNSTDKDNQESQEQNFIKGGEKSTTISNPSLKATVDEDTEDRQYSLIRQQEEEEQAKLREQERQRISTLLESIEQNLIDFQGIFQKSNTPQNLEYEHIDRHFEQIVKLAKDLQQFAIPSDLIKPEFKEALADLEDELARLNKDKHDLIVQISKRSEEISEILEKRLAEEKSTIAFAENQIDDEQFESALEELNKIKYHELKEKDRLIKKIKKIQKDKQEEEDRLRREEEERQRLQREEEQRIIREKEEAERKKKEEEERKQREQEEEIKKKQKEEEDRKRKEEEDRKIKEQQEKERKEKEQREKEEKERKQREEEEERKRQELLKKQREEEERLENEKRELERKQREEEQRILREKEESEKRKMAELKIKKMQEDQDRQERIRQQRFEEEKRQRDEEEQMQQKLLEQQRLQQQRASTEDSDKDGNQGGGGGSGFLILVAVLGIAAAAGFLGYKQLKLR